MRGRPTKLNPRIAMQIRLTPKERETLDLAAQAKGLQTSTWMRFVCLEAAKAVAKAGR